MPTHFLDVFQLEGRHPERLYRSAAQLGVGALGQVHHAGQVFAHVRHHVLADNLLVGEADGGFGAVQVELARDGLGAVDLEGQRLHGLHHQAGQALGVPHPDVGLQDGTRVELVGAVGEQQVRDDAAALRRLQVGVVVLAAAPRGLGGGVKDTH